MSSLLAQLEGGAVDLASLRAAAKLDFDALAARHTGAWLVDPSVAAALDQTLAGWRAAVRSCCLDTPLLPSPTPPGSDAAHPELLLLLPPRTELANDAATIAAKCAAAARPLALAFSSPPSDACTAAFAAAGLPAASSLRLHWVPVERDLAVCCDDSLPAFAAALHALQTECGMAPAVRGKGAAARAVADELLRLRCAVGPGTAAAAAAPPPLLLLLSRSSDWMSVLVTQATYAGLLDELLGIDAGQVPLPPSSEPALGNPTGRPAKRPPRTPINSGDPVVAQLGDAAFGDACDALREQASALDAGHKRLAAPAGAEVSLSDVRAFVKALRAFRGTELLERHIELARALRRLAARRSFRERLGREEAAVAVGGAGGPDGFGNGPGADLAAEAAELGRRGAPLLAPLRALCLASVCAGPGGMPFKRYVSARRALVHAYGREGLDAWRRLRAAGLLLPPAQPLLMDATASAVASAAAALTPALVSGAVAAAASAAAAAASLVPGARAAAKAAKAAVADAKSLAGAMVPVGGSAAPQAGFPAARGPLRLLREPGTVEQPDLSFVFAHAALVPLSARLAQAGVRGWRAGGAAAAEGIKAQPGVAFEHGQGLDSKGRCAELPIDARATEAALARGGGGGGVLVALCGGVTRAEVAALRALSRASVAAGGPSYTVLAPRLITGQSALGWVAAGGWEMAGWGDEAARRAAAAEERATAAETPLHAAAADGDVTEIHRLLDGAGSSSLLAGGARAMLDAASYAGHTALHCAVLGGSAAAVAALLARGAALLAADDGGDTALHLAASCDDSGDIVRVLLADAGAAPVMAANRHGLTPIHIAAGAAGGADALAWLLEAADGADPPKDEKGRSPVHCAAAAGRAAALSLLLKRGGTEKVTASNGGTPLHAACEGGHEECARILLDAGAAVDAAAKGGWTPLHAAARCEEGAGCVKLLLARGAAPAARAAKGTPLEVAVMEGNEEAAALLLAAGAEAVAELPPRRGFCCFGGGGGPPPPPPKPAAEATEQGWTLLMLAASKGRAPLMEVLIKEGADVHATASEPAGWTALHFAAFEGSAEAVSVALLAGARAGARTGDGRTPLHLAAACEAAGGGGARAAAALLAVSWEELNAVDEEGSTALHLAAAGGQDELVKLLLERGADATTKRASDGRTAAETVAADRHALKAMLEHAAKKRTTAA